MDSFSEVVGGRAAEYNIWMKETKSKPNGCRLKI